MTVICRYLPLPDASQDGDEGGEGRGEALAGSVSPQKVPLRVMGGFDSVVETTVASAAVCEMLNGAMVRNPQLAREGDGWWRRLAKVLSVVPVQLDTALFVPGETSTHS